MEMYREQFGELVCGYRGLKGYGVFFILFCLTQEQIYSGALACAAEHER